MPDYRLYCSTAGITNAEMVEKLKSKYPKYTKATQSMVCNPADYAVQLIPAAEDLLMEAFGYAPGLAAPDPDVKRRKEHGNKAKPNRLYVRLDNELMERVKNAAARMHFAFMQDLVEAALLQFVDRYGVGADAPGGPRYGEEVVRP
jgi:hypothetical protein